jgi:ubiquinone/menaquinone biosynthesis C-methylase UbiE
VAVLLARRVHQQTKITAAAKTGIVKPAAPYNNEQHTAAAFNRQSPLFDTLYSNNTIIRYKRERVRSHIQHYLKPNSYILELNSGTGEDAVWFAQQGHRVHATDISAGMQQQLIKKVQAAAVQHAVSTELISFTALQELQIQQQFDHIFSNFAGLNCTGELQIVLASFNNLVKPGGIVTMVILPKFCLWEFLLLLKGQFKTAFRRFFSGRGAAAHIEGTHFTCWYYNPSYIVRHLQPGFELLEVEGLCTLVPPSYMEGFAEKHPRLYRFLTRQENRLRKTWPWKVTGDYYIISLRKKAV